MNPKDLKQKFNKYLRRKFRGQGHMALRHKIVRVYGDNIDLIDEFEKMQSWCASKGNKKASLLRFNNWLKNSVKFRIERGELEQSDVDTWDQEEQKTREKINKAKEEKKKLIDGK